jgi:hypothetical protein
MVRVKVPVGAVVHDARPVLESVVPRDADRNLLYAVVGM